jgi:hypothetical protein
MNPLMSAIHRISAPFSGRTAPPPPPPTNRALERRARRRARRLHCRLIKTRGSRYDGRYVVVDSYNIQRDADDDVGNILSRLEAELLAS